VCRSALCVIFNSFKKVNLTKDTFFSKIVRFIQFAVFFQRIPIIRYINFIHFFLFALILYYNTQYFDFAPVNSGVLTR